MTQLQELRKSKGYTQAKVAIDCNIPLGTYSTMETGRAAISYENAKKLSDYYGVEIKQSSATYGKYGYDKLEYTQEILAEVRKERDELEVKNKELTMQIDLLTHVPALSPSDDNKVADLESKLLKANEDYNELGSKYKATANVINNLRADLESLENENDKLKEELNSHKCASLNAISVASVVPDKYNEINDMLLDYVKATISELNDIVVGRNTNGLKLMNTFADKMSIISKIAELELN